MPGAMQSNNYRTNRAFKVQRRTIFRPVREARSRPCETSRIASRTIQERSSNGATLEQFGTVVYAYCALNDAESCAGLVAAHGYRYKVSSRAMPLAAVCRTARHSAAQCGRMPCLAPAQGTKNAIGGAASRVKLNLKNILSARVGGL
jgi:hypothetical protein